MFVDKQGLHKVLEFDFRNKIVYSHPNKDTNILFWSEYENKINTEIKREHNIS